MTYGGFAYLYDELMQDVPYDQWVKKLIGTVGKYQPDAKTILDVACGTGELSIRLSEAGFSVVGMDLSEDMLSVAHTKTIEKGLVIPYFQQNMVEMEDLGTFDVITIFCDSLNYLGTEEEVKTTFNRVFKHLLPGGVFMFDVHSIFKMTEIFKDGTFVSNGEEISYIWQCYEGEWTNSVEHELSFFVLDEYSGKYDRIDELHFQRTFSIDHYIQWLTEAGFDLLAVTADFHDHAPKSDSERIFFTARKLSPKS